MITTESKLTDSFFNVLDKFEIQAKDFAQKIHVSKSALSNWKSDRAIPDYIKTAIANELGDPEFKSQVANNMLEIPTVPTDSDVLHDALAQTVHLWYLERSKYDLVSKIEEILAHQKISFDDRNLITKFCQKLKNEIGTEMQLLAILQSKYSINDKEVTNIAK